MIYLDNAATTSPKPKSVVRACDYALKELCANPGRSGHALSVKAADAVYKCRVKAAEFFGLDNSEKVVFTKNCTEALNTVIKGLALENCEVITSCFEHNSVARPLFSLKKRGVKTRIAKVYFGDRQKTVDSFRSLITDKTRLIICTHASNVCGTILPIREIGELCRERSIPFAVDGAQSAGMVSIDMKRDGIDFLCLPGHKGLYGPMGTGLLLCSGSLPDTLTEGGTGNLSNSLFQPDDLPERLESGTVNVPGIAGLSAGIDFVKKAGISRINRHEKQLCAILYKGLSDNKSITVYGENPTVTSTAPVVSFNINGIPSEQVSAELSSRGIAVRAGLHCAPFAHEALGTLKTGTVRVSFSVFNTPDEVKHLVKSIENIQKII